MKILFLGDVVGRSGRDAVVKHLPKLRKDWALDFVVVDGDNSAAGFGITGAICKDYFEAGADVVTGGDHVWDQKDIVPYISQEKRLLRPQNFPQKVPGNGHLLTELSTKKKVLTLHLLGQVFHKEHTNCPFAEADKILGTYKLGSNVDAIIVDFHAEATSEKTAMGQYLDGRVSVVVGSHTHIPTADARVLSKGTAYQTDGGMCGDYNSVIGFDTAGPFEKFLTKVPKFGKLEPAEGEATLCGLLVETDGNGLAVNCKPVQYPKPL